jgi:ANTAR domain-containing protein/GAF domain-containing protein
MTATPFTPAQLAEIFTDIGRHLAAAADSDSALQALAEAAVARVPAADYAGVTAGRKGKISTVAATDDLVHRTDAIQYRLGSGPCVDAVEQDTTFNVADLRTDPRWPEFGRRATERTGIVSMLSLRMFFEADHGLVAGLNMYSSQPDAFGETSEAMGVLLATHGALALANAAARQKNTDLEFALASSREIGIAIGVLMALQKVTRDQAFQLLVIASQRTHRKVADLAHDVADTGVLPD